MTLRAGMCPARQAEHAWLAPAPSRPRASLAGRSHPGVLSWGSPGLVSWAQGSPSPPAFPVVSETNWSQSPHCPTARARGPDTRLDPGLRRGLGQGGAPGGVGRRVEPSEGLRVTLSWGLPGPCRP